MSALLKNNLVRIFVLIMLLGVVPTIVTGLTGSSESIKNTSSIINVSEKLANSTFYSNNSNQQFSDSLQLNITPSGGVDLNTTGIDYMVILDASGSMGTSVGMSTRWNYAVSWVNQFVSTLRTIDRLSLIIFSASAALQFAFQTNANANASNAMNNAVPSGTANTADAIVMAISEYTNDSTPTTPKMIYLLTDGPYSSGNDPCGNATLYKAMHAKTYINTLGAWDGSTLACLVDNSTTDIFSTSTTVTFNSTLIQENLNNFGNLTGTNIELHLDLNNNLIFAYSYNPTTSIVTGNTRAAVWKYAEIRTYYYEKHLNFSISFEISGIGVIPVYYGTSYLSYTSASNTTVTVQLNELDINIINPYASSNSLSSTTTNTMSTSSNTTSSKGLDAQMLFGMLGLVALSMVWQQKRKLK